MDGDDVLAPADEVKPELDDIPDFVSDLAIISRRMLVKRQDNNPFEGESAAYNTQ